MFNKSLAAIIFWSSFQSITLEVLLTRIYSATLGYNYAYVIISIALGGLGIGALLTLSGWAKASYTTIMVATAVSLPILLVCIAFIPASLDTLWFYFTASCIPFILTGLIFSKAMGANGPEAHFIYFSDLLAASLAPPASVALMYLIDPQMILLASSISGIVIAMILQPKRTTQVIFSRRTFAVTAVALIACSGFVGFNFSSGALSSYPTPLKPALNYARQQGWDYATIWNPISRVDLVGPGGGGTLGSIIIDGDASTPILQWNQNQSSTVLPITNFMLHVPYSLGPRRNVLVIGAGGGTDVDEALMSGAQNITAVEVNPAVAGIVEGFGASAGNIYSNPKVHLYIDEGRSFLGRSNSSYDLIAMTLVDSWAAVSTGAYATSEQYLYTTNAFTSMLNHLTPNGTLVLVRWDLELPKVMTSLAQALENIGVPPNQIGEHIAVFGQVKGEVSTYVGNVMIIVKKTAFTSSDLSILNGVTPYQHVYVSGENSSTIYGKFFSSGANESVLAAYFPNQRIIPATDSSPYYFDFTKGIPNQMTQALEVNIGIAALIGIIAFGSKTSRRGIGEAKVRWLGYYGLIGLGFILIEIALLQRLTLLIGYPTIAFASLLFFLLISSAVGSLLSSKIKDSEMPKILFSLCLLASAGSFIFVYLLPAVVERAVSLGIIERVTISGLLMAPLGILMGIPFPSGLRWLSNIQKGNNSYGGAGEISMAIGVNFIASVIASVLAVIIGIYFGVGLSLIVASICYLAAGVVWLSSRKGTVDFRKGRIEVEDRPATRLQ